MTLTDGSILRRIGLQLQRDSHGVAKPQPVEGRRSATVPTACAWCDSEAGVAIDPNGPPVSHGICPRHLAAIKADLERRRLAEAA
jgi:hypothetical protein